MGQAGSTSRFSAGFAGLTIGVTEVATAVSLAALLFGGPLADVRLMWSGLERPELALELNELMLHINFGRVMDLTRRLNRELL